MSPLSNLLCDARKNGNAIAAFNAPGADAMLAIGRAANRVELPAIVQISASTVRSLGTEILKAWFDATNKVTGGRLFLHLDHCDDLTLISDCINAGWDMVMVDGSSLPIHDNLTLTQEVVSMARAHGVAVEAEIGGVSGEEDGHLTCSEIADPSEIGEFARKSGADCVAIGFGNAHGHYKSTCGLRWEVLEAAANLTDLPLVLHGGTGLSSAEFQRAIRIGCAKINISTALKDAYVETLTEDGIMQKIRKSPLQLHERLQQMLATTCQTYITQFNRGGFN